MRLSDIDELLQELANVAAFLVFMKHFLKCQRQKEEIALIEDRLIRAMFSLSKKLDMWVKP